MEMQNYAYLMIIYLLLFLAKAGANEDSELRILDEVSAKSFEKINKLLTAKDEEIANLRVESKIMSDHWKLKTKELESQVSVFSFSSMLSYTFFVYFFIFYNDLDIFLTMFSS
ncbi:hypothetical protein ACH5RR_001707 [Cinchona calisaya]|uniref:Uncharacterized protein n=1 Tax=Cinchona calisaya TaxID=153742 RepID=A0ABD3B4T5_9GENT